MNFPTRWLDGIQAVTFDAGGTLLEPWPSVGHVYSDVAARHGRGDISPELLNRRFADAWRAKQNFEHTRADWRRLVDQTFAGLFAEPPTPALFDALYHRFTEPDAWRVFEDVFSTLAALRRRGLKLGIVSNWDERLRPLLQRLHLDGHFEAVVVSLEAGCTKPAPDIFRQAAARLNVPSAAMLHVGDSPTEDLAGARAAGMRAVLVDRRAEESSGAVVTTLAELASSLAAPGASADAD